AVSGSTRNLHDLEGETYELHHQSENPSALGAAMIHDQTIAKPCVALASCCTSVSEKCFASLACALRQTGIAASRRRAPASVSQTIRRRRSPSTAAISTRPSFSRLRKLRESVDCSSPVRRASAPSVSSDKAAICAIKPSWATVSPADASSRSRNWEIRRAASRLLQPAHSATSRAASVRRVFRACDPLAIDVCIYKICIYMQGDSNDRDEIRSGHS